METLEDAQKSLTQGDAFFEKENIAEAKRCYLQAAQIQKRLAPDSLEYARTLKKIADCFLGENTETAMASVKDYIQRSLPLFEKHAPVSEETATAYRFLGNIALDKGDNTDAKHFFIKELAIVEKMQPETRLVATSLRNLGNTSRMLGELEEATQYYKRALGISEKIAPDGLAVAFALDGLGAVAFARSDFSEALKFYERAFVILQKETPDSFDSAINLNNQGQVAAGQGNLARAMQLYERALAIYEKVAPDNLNLGRTTNNLGDVARQQGNLALAKQYFMRGLTFFEKQEKDSLLVAWSLNSLANIAESQGDFSLAQQYQERALIMQERHDPTSADVATSLSNLGNLVSGRGNNVLAKQYYTKALAVFEKIAPNSNDTAMVLNNLGEVQRDTGEKKEAQILFEKSLRLYERNSPDSLNTVYVISNLAHLLLESKQLTPARQFFLRGVTIVEAQRKQILLPENRVFLQNIFVPLYTGLMQAYVQSGDIASALHTQERLRARSLLESLHQKDLKNTIVNAAPSIKKEAESLHQKRQTLYQELAKAPMQANDPKVREIQQGLLVLQQQEEKLVEQIRRVSPRYAALRFPVPLGSKEIQQTLPSGTLLLSFSVLENEVILFAITRTTLQSFTVPALAKDIALKVALFQSGLQKGEYRFDLGKSLFTLLFGSVLPQIEKSARVLLCADGPLQSLSFSALVTDGTAKMPRFFIDKKPLHQTVSLTVYKEIRAKPPLSMQGHSLKMLAIGDPAYPQEKNTLKAVSRSQESLRDIANARLPETAKEAKAVAALFGAVPLLGSGAKKSVLQQQIKGVHLLHLACHGFLDRHDPMASGLKLVPEKDKSGKNEAGFLQAWELYTPMWDLQASLVTLSACETGGGQDAQTEGILSLARAFHFAGAKAVVSSLWRVEDKSTAFLMEAFYKELKTGVAKDVALQRAMQVTRQKSRVWSSPRHWAAFVLTGDVTPLHPSLLSGGKHPT
jgi:tetratricopeptide (TPR) repeat protein